MLSFPAWPNTWISVVFATVAWPPMTGIAPPLIRIWPAALRLTVIVSSVLSPKTDSRPVLGEKLALIAMVGPFGGLPAAETGVGR